MRLLPVQLSILSVGMLTFTLSGSCEEPQVINVARQSPLFYTSATLWKSLQITSTLSKTSETSSSYGDRLQSYLSHCFLFAFSQSHLYVFDLVCTGVNVIVEVFVMCLMLFLKKKIFGPCWK